MYVAITCCIMTYSISKGFVTYHGSMECEINYNYNYWCHLTALPSMPSHNPLPSFDPFQQPYNLYPPASQVGYWSVSSSFTIHLIMPLFRDLAYNKACPHLPDWLTNHNLIVNNQTTRNSYLHVVPAFHHSLWTPWPLKDKGTTFLQNIRIH